MLKKAWVWLGVLVCATSAFGTTLNDATLSDSLTGWSTAGAGDAVISLNDTDVLAGTYSVQVTGTPGFFLKLSRALPESVQFTQNTLTSLHFDFKVLTADTDWAMRIFLADSAGATVASWARWGSSGNLTTYWGGTGITQDFFSWTAGKEDVVVTQIQVSAEYMGQLATVRVDDMSITTIPEPATLSLIMFGAVGYIIRKKR